MSQYLFTQEKFHFAVERKVMPFFYAVVRFGSVLFLILFWSSSPFVFGFSTADLESLLGNWRFKKVFCIQQDEIGSIHDAHWESKELRKSKKHQEEQKIKISQDVFFSKWGRGPSSFSSPWMLVFKTPSLLEVYQDTKQKTKRGTKKEVEPLFSSAYELSQGPHASSPFSLCVSLEGGEEGRLLFAQATAYTLHLDVGPDEELCEKDPSSPYLSHLVFEFSRKMPKQATQGKKERFKKMKGKKTKPFQKR